MNQFVNGSEVANVRLRMQLAASALHAGEGVVWVG